MPPHMTTELNRPYVPPTGTTVTGTVDVTPGRKSDGDGVVRHIALCIDTSGSMHQDGKIGRAREGVRWVCGLLDDEDYLTIISFDSDAEQILRPTRWGDISRDEAMETVDELTSGGGTNMYDGIEVARKALASLADREGMDGTPVRRLLLLSDGKDQHREPHEFTDVAQAVDNQGIRIEAAGIGDEYEEETIRTLGTTARGKWTHLQEPGDIEEFFGEAVEQAKSVVAPDAQLELDVAPGVEVSDVYRAVPQAQEVSLDWEANTAIVRLPDLTEREEQRVVMKFHVPAAADVDQDGESGPLTLADVTLTARGGKASETITVEYTEDPDKLAEHKEAVQLDHQQTVIKTELGKGNVEAAETKVEKMTKIHGDDAEPVDELKAETQLVKEGGRAEQSQATQIVTDDDRIQ